MALSDEQNAMLRLLASGEQGYGDIAALMGLSEEDVRAKVVGALAQLQAEGKPAPEIPPPVPGGAKPAAEAVPPEPEPVVPAKPEAPAEPVMAESIAPKEPAAQAPAAAPPPIAVPPPSGGRTITVPSGRKAWLIGGGVLAAIAVIVVVIILVSSGGGDSSSTAASEGTTTTAAESKGEGSAAEKEPTRAELTAVDGSEAAGLATFGRYKNKLALQVEATGLEPTTEGTDAYTIWLAQSPTKMIPLAFPVPVKGSGKTAGTIGAEFEVPVEVLAYLANATFDEIAITKTKTAPMEASLERATKAKTTPVYTGEAVLRGTIVGPIVGLAKREKEEKGK